MEAINQIENLKIVEIDTLSNDAFHVAVMKKHGVKNIATNDRDFERVDGIKVWKS